MKTKPLSANASRRPRLGRLFHCFATAAAIVASSLLFVVPPTFAQANVGTDPDDPLPWGSVTVANPPDPLGYYPAQRFQSSRLARTAIPPAQPQSQPGLAPQAANPYGSDLDNPPDWGSSVVPGPSNNYGDVSPYAYSGDVSSYLFHGNDTLAPSESPQLDAAPQQPPSPTLPPAYVPPDPDGLVESFEHGPINPSFPELPPEQVQLPGTLQGRLP